MNGADYRATKRLSTKADETLAEVGDTCERVPVSSLPLLLASGHIEPVTAIPEAVWTDLGRPADDEELVF